MMLETLDTLLRLTLIQQYHDKATAKKMSIKLAKKVNPHVKKMVLDKVLASSDPKATCTEHALSYLAMNQAAKEISEMGFIGMITHEGTAYPMRIIIEDEHDKQYVLNNEPLIAQKAASRFEEELQVPRSKVDVQFFKNRGFTGTRYQIAVGA